MDKFISFDTGLIVKILLKELACSRILLYPYFSMPIFWCPTKQVYISSHLPLILIIPSLHVSILQGNIINPPAFLLDAAGNIIVRSVNSTLRREHLARFNAYMHVCAWLTSDDHINKYRLKILCGAPSRRMPRRAKTGPGKGRGDADARARTRRSCCVCTEVGHWRFLPCRILIWWPLWRWCMICMFGRLFMWPNKPQRWAGREGDCCVRNWTRACKCCGV